jgi:hypothetical protein
VFSKPIVKDLFSRYTLVRLYGDYLPAGYPPKPSAEENSAFQATTFGNNQRPFYAILQPLQDGKFSVVASYGEGYIGDVPAFIEFLKAPLAAVTQNSGNNRQMTAGK